MPVDYRKYFYFVFSILILPIFLLAQSTLININTAGLTELKTLNGIGDVKGQAIINYRTQNGLFQKIDDIKNVSGIGDVTFSNIKNFITVGSTASTSDSGTTSTSTVSNQTSSNDHEQTSTTTIPAQDEVVSVHYSFIPISNVIPQPVYKVGAGRPRIATVSTPIEFKGESNTDYSGQTNYRWSFGDGSMAYGHIVSHSYAYSGEYVVVLNATSPAGQAVSRTDVKIVPDDFIVSDASPEKIEVQNNSSYEINLFGRALRSEGKIFVFPQDTIIKPNQKISFANIVTGLHPFNKNDASLITVGDSLNKNFTSTVLLAENKPDINKVQIGILYSKALNIQKQLATLIDATDYSGTASAVVALNSLASSTSTSAPETKRGWFEKIKLFFFGE